MERTTLFAVACEQVPDWGIGRQQIPARRVGRERSRPSLAPFVNGFFFSFVFLPLGWKLVYGLSLQLTHASKIHVKSAPVQQIGEAR